MFVGHPISIHALREESDSSCRATPEPPNYFNPRPPRGGRPSLSFDASPICFISIHALREESDLDATLAITCRMYFNPRPPRGERRNRPVAQPDPGAISIHALREEGDRGAPCGHLQNQPISIHALREEGDLLLLLPLHPKYCYFNPRPPRGGRLQCGLPAPGSAANFNPRPPRGGRPAFFNGEGRHDVFQSTPSARRATTCVGSPK